MTLTARFSRNLRAQRKARQWSVRALARKAKVSHPTVVMLEQGSRSPSLDMVDALARGLKLPDAAVLLEG